MEEIVQPQQLVSTIYCASGSNIEYWGDVASTRTDVLRVFWAIRAPGSLRTCEQVDTRLASKLPQECSGHVS